MRETLVNGSVVSIPEGGWRQHFAFALGEYAAKVSKRFDIEIQVENANGPDRVLVVNAKSTNAHRITLPAPVCYYNTLEAFTDYVRDQLIQAHLRDPKAMANMPKGERALEREERLAALDDVKCCPVCGCSRGRHFTWCRYYF